MKISLNWIKDYVDITPSDEQKIIDKLTVVTSELEGVEHRGADYDNIFVGEIVECTAHPDSQKLHLLKVNVGKEILDIVCGAPNARKGIKVPVVVVGGHIAGTKIKPAKLGGYISNGMCCSAEELGIEEKSDGILELDMGAVVGSDAIEELELRDTVLEIDNKSLTNRPDLWGHYGFAREIAAILGKTLKPMSVVDLSLYNSLPALDVQVEDKEMCLRYTAIRVNNIDNVETPIYIKKRLTYCGMRPINMIADLTNYVMLEMSQPMHAFDGEKVKGIIVKRVMTETAFASLDNIVRTIPANTTVIADENGVPSAIAGIKGGLNSEITENTTQLVLESACFDAANVRKTSVALGLRTDSSNRLEKSLDPEQCAIATARYLQLLREISPQSQVASQFADVYSFHYPKRVITVSHELIKKYLGKPITSAEVKKILTSLEMKVLTDKYEVEVPSFRATKDITLPVDIIEEVARMHGYDQLEPAPFQSVVTPTERDQYLEDRFSAKESMATDFGYIEVNSYVFKNKNFIKEYSLPDTKNTKVLGALSPAHSELRSNLDYTILEASVDNLKSSGEVKIFEIGSIFDGTDKDGLVIEKSVLCMGHSSRTTTAEALYRKTASLILELVKTLKNVQLEFVPTNVEIGHPKISADIVYDGIVLGKVYAVHPRICAEVDKKVNIIIANLDMQLLSSISKKVQQYVPISKFPSIDIDISFLVEKEMTFGEVKTAISSIKNKVLTKVALVEVYKSDALEGKKSVTVRFTLSSMNKTFTADDVKNFGDRICAELQGKNIIRRY